MVDEYEEKEWMHIYSTSSFNTAVASAISVPLAFDALQKSEIRE